MKVGRRPALEWSSRSPQRDSLEALTAARRARRPVLALDWVASIRYAGAALGLQLRSQKDRALPCRIPVARPDPESRPRVDPETPRPKSEALTPDLLTPDLLLRSLNEPDDLWREVRYRTGNGDALGYDVVLEVAP